MGNGSDGGGSGRVVLFESETFVLEVLLLVFEMGFEPEDTLDLPDKGEGNERGRGGGDGGGGGDDGLDCLGGVAEM